MSVRYMCDRAIVPQSEYDRIRKSVSFVPDTTNPEKERLRELSKTRSAQWTNTLIGNRQMKLVFKIVLILQKQKAEREKALELERQEIDRAEDKAREEYRLETIDRANRLLEEETDRMKMLKSKTMLVDTLIEREHQQVWKQRKQEMEKKREAIHYQEMLDRMKAEKEREDRERAERIEKCRQTALINAQQMKAWEDKYTTEILEERKEGKIIADKAKAELEEERQERLNRRLKFIADSKAMLQANAEVEEFKRTQDEHFNNLDKKNAEWARKKDEQEERRKRQWEKRQQDRLRTTNFLISRATEALKYQTDNSERILQKQIKEHNAKEDEAERLKEQKAQEEWNAIVKSRTYQLEEKARLEREQKEKDKEFAIAWKKQNEQFQKEEYAERMRVLNRNKKNAEEIHKQAIEREERKRKVREEEILNEEADLKKVDDEDARVYRRAMALLEKYEKAGKNTLPLRRAMLPIDELHNAMQFNQ